MAQIDDLQNFVNFELPRRAPFLNVTTASYDGDPNDGGAPVVLKNAPVGTEYLRDTPTRLYKKTTAGATGWVEIPGEGTRTLEDLTFPVDYNDGTAVDPPAGTVLSSQQAIDDFLAANSATNFKHLQRAWEALPPLLGHIVTFNLAAGVHRPLPGAGPSEAAIELTGRLSVGGGVVLQGAAPSNYTTLVSSQSITGVNTGTDPYLDFAGTPFAGLDLDGAFAVLSTGQVCCIHDHTDSRLFCVESFSPDPTGGSVVVAEPSTKFRNSLDDVAGLTGLLFQSDWPSPITPGFVINDVLFDNFGGSNGAFLTSEGGLSLLTRVIVDQLSMIAAFSKTPNGSGYLVYNGSEVTLTTCTHRSVKPAGPGADWIFIAGTDATLNCISGYFAGGNNGSRFTERSRGSFWRSVFDQSGSAESILIDASELQTFDFQAIRPGKPNIIRGAAATSLKLNNGGYSASTFFFDHLEFQDSTGPCVVFGSNARANLTPATTGWIDVGGNLDIGIEMLGPGAQALLNTGTDVTGALGDVRMADGDILSYSDVSTDGPFIDEVLNIISRG